MAEKQLAYRASGKEEFFADDDPLAELARIVGFDERSAAPAAQAAPRREPEFNLEDELLHEFERYDAPALSPVDDIVIPSDDVEAHRHAQSEPEADLEAPIVAEAQAERADPEFAALDRADEFTAVEPEAEEVSGWQFEEVPAVELAPVYGDGIPPAAAAPQALASEAQDLADELEMSIAPVSSPTPAQRTPQWAAASIRLPLANFNTARRLEVKPEPVVVVEENLPALDASPGSQQSPTLGFPAEQDRHEVEVVHQSTETVAEPVVAPSDHVFDLAAAAGDARAVQADAALTEPAYADEPASLSRKIDDLLDDVSRYPVPERDAMKPSVETPVADVAPVRQAVPVAAAPSAVQPQAKAADEEDPFAGHDFELDLAGIELELADFDFRSSQSSQVAPQPVAAAPVSSPAPITPTIAAAAVAASQFAQAVRPEMADRPAPAAVAPASAPMSGGRRVVEDADQPLPFDPSEISDTGERLETFEGTHVPALPHTDHEEPVAVSPEFDFDIDAEMASLFSAAEKAEVSEAVTPAKSADPAMPAAWAKHAVAKVSAAPSKDDELDEFERALEEDFRRSVREASSPGPTEAATRMTLESASAVADRRRVRSMRGLAAGIAAIVVLGVGVYGVREWVSGGSSIGIAAGQPRVITADKDPVKVVPEDPGGKVVPNQDKAVYDRVAGDAAAAPKQKELIASAEQPIDVVQKTLETEAPDESDNPEMQASPTPVGETEDPRLLPNHNSGADTAAADTDQAIPSVSPRKVRTMIVKPDGTLVAREDAAPVTVDTSVKTSASPAAPPIDKTSGKVASTTLRPASEKAASAPASALAEAADSDAASAESTPIRVVKTTKTEGVAKPAAAVVASAPATPSAVAPAAPATQPVKPAVVAEKPAVAAAKPVVAAAADKPKAQPVTQVASASPATQPVKAAPSAAAGAGGYAVQIASLPSEAEAKKSQASLTAKFASVIGGHSTEVKRADIAGKGTYYRVRVLASSKDEAADLCVKLRQVGGTCLISK